MKQWVEQFNGRMDAWVRKLHEKEIRKIGRASCRERVCQYV